MDSILTTIKKLLGLPEEVEEFDTDIIIHINSVLAILTQLGVGPETGFHITGKNETWNDFINDDQLIAEVKSYMYMKVRLMFDPPTNSAVLASFERLISEFEWRCYVEMDNRKMVT